MKKIIISIAFLLIINYSKATNPIAEFYSNDNYPRWTDEINWNNKLNMQTFDFTAAGCIDCSSDFKKFEFARDYVYAQGGGVLYYPEGDYYFNDIATWGNSPVGKGLLLKKGVVILGETPTTSIKAVPWEKFNASLDATQQDIYKNHGLTSMKTRFHFPFKEVDQYRIIESKDPSGKGLIPYTWNFIGITKGINESGLKDVSHVGIAWVQLDGAYIFFGFDANWAPTWDQSVSSWLVNANKKAGINGWNGRIPDGTHTFDIWCGVNAQTGQGGVGSIYTGEKRFVFGCRLDNACVSNYMFDGTWCKIGGVFQYGLGDNFLSGGSFRYASKITVYGSNLFIANNVISISGKNFIFKSKMIDRSTNTLTVDDKNLLFSYGYGHCIDVNKQLISQVYNRCDFDSGIQFKENIVIKDNWLHNAAGKVLDVSGKYMIIQHNVGWKYKCDNNGWRVYGFTNPFIIPFQYGATISKATDDFMNRFIDLGSFNSWIDNNWYTGTGSLANDGEGILIQKTPGEMSAFSLAITNNICGKTGQGKYMGVWDTRAYGYLAAKNKTSSTLEGWVGVFGGGISCSAYDNFLNDSSDRSMVNKRYAVNFGDWSPNEDSIFAPENVTVNWDATKKAYIISWKDISKEEMAYIVERTEKGMENWRRIAYRPRQEGNTNVINFNLGTANGKTCTATGEFNPSNWIDYLTCSGKNYEYRVGTVYTLTSDRDKELIKYALITNENSLPTDQLNKPDFKVFPNPVTNQLTLITKEKGLLNYNIFDINGTKVLSGSTDMTTKIDVSKLKSGLYLIQISSKNKLFSQKIVKN